MLHVLVISLTRGYKIIQDMFMIMKYNQELMHKTE